jgi:type I restriction-modification system DNA methylase subunit
MAIVFPTVFCFVVVQKVTYASINKENYLDAVIGMPANIFLRNSIPTFGEETDRCKTFC